VEVNFDGKGWGAVRDETTPGHAGMARRYGLATRMMLFASRPLRFVSPLFAFEAMASFRYFTPPNHQHLALQPKRLTTYASG